MQKSKHSVTESHTETAGGIALSSSNSVGINRPSGIPASPPYDPFAEENIRLPQELLDEAIAHTGLTIVPVQKPGDQEFIRVHPSADYRHIAAIIEYNQEKGAPYLVHPSCVAQVKGFGIKFHFQTLYFYTTREGNFYWWPIKLPKDGRENKWLDSARDAAETAIRKWVSVRSNQELGAYTTHTAVDNDDFNLPEWPTKNGVPFTKNELLSLAFKERLIMDVEHPVIRKLRGANVK